jgi:hypothetical protein
MHLPLRLVETEPGSYSLLLDALTAVDGAIKEVGHEPNGYFWEGVARYLVQTEAPALADSIFYDPEGSMFCANAGSRDVLEALAALMRPLTTDAARVRRLVTDAVAAGFQFDD